MNLSGLLSLLDGRRWYARLLRDLQGAVPPEQAVVRASVPEPAKPMLLAALQRDLGRPLLVVAASEHRARDLAAEVQAWSADPEAVALLPAPEPLFYERLPSAPSTARARLQALGLLAADAPRALVVAPVRALMRPVMAPSAFRALCRTVRPGDRLRPTDLAALLLDLGYQPEPLVEDPGTFARRGGIVDVFPVDRALPLRVEFFGDEVESIREFDPATQRSRRSVEFLALSPSREVPAPAPEALAALRAVNLDGLTEAARSQWERDLERLADGLAFDGLEFYAPYLCAHAVLDYLPDAAVVVLDEPHAIASAAADLVRQAEELRLELVEHGELPAGFAVAYLDWPALERRLARLARLCWTWQDLGAVDDDPDRRARPADLHPVPSYAGRLRAALDDLERWRRDRLTTVLVTGQAGRVGELLADYGQPAAAVTEVRTAPEPGALVLVHGALGEGFLLAAGAGGGLVVLTDRELFGWTRPVRAAPVRRPNREKFLSDLAPGDYVVHVDHGIGRFAGMVRMGNADGQGEREYLLLEYAAGDRLYVPSDQADRLSRYVGVGDQPPTLHRLGTGDWARARSRVRAAVRELARDLLRLYAARQVTPGYAFGPDTVWQAELEDAFPYVETPDQRRAIAEVKADMERPRPMDRLLCGDVGYGKTEVALRAAFKAVNDGKQVAMLVPTTVLAQQHFNTFRERLQAFPVRVEMLSRFRSEKEQRQIIADLASGKIDICIGTHRLLQKDVTFKDLGLVIIDEEQRFGVLHKEHFKKLRTAVDVLTLSATPIPRTLHMALVGVRDLSVMETPPEDRLPIRTTVTTYDDRLVREVILREIDRGGQVYFVHNRVQTIYQVAQRLAELVPEASIVVGHGQMPEEELEKVMLDFAAGRYDVLVCSTIIESGLDIPNVNTIIVDRADHFGLAQLYQLRGRVGRGANRAYAYFLTPRDRRLSEVAEKRLRTILEASDLGAGYRIAMKDLEIRGAGNLLGAEQHGHVAAVGFHLYTQMLAEEVKALRGEIVERPLNVTIDLPIDAYLPASYVEDEQARLGLYTRMAGLDDPNGAGDLLQELRDRFGEPPAPALNLIYLVQLKALARLAGIVAISDEGDRVLLQLADGLQVDPEPLRRRFGPLLTIGRSQLRLDKGRAGANWLGVLQEVVEQAGRALAGANGRSA